MRKLRETLSAALIERDAEVRAVLLGLVAQEHVLLVGPPGTAKSLLAANLAKALKACHFGILLTKFTTPEEVFGPISLSALRADRYERVTDGYAADAEVVFLDEVFKASTAILNTLLTLLEERRYVNGRHAMSTPLMLAVGASNEWPSSEEGAELGALFDRWTIRRAVRPVTPAGLRSLLYAQFPAVEPVATIGAVAEATARAAVLPVSEPAQAAMDDILMALSAEGIRPSDRRCRKAIAVARAAALLDGAPEVTPAHLEDLAMVLWADPAQADKTEEIVTKVANPVGARVNALLREVDEILSHAADPAAQMAAIKKLEDSEAELGRLTKQGNGRASAARQYVRLERVRMQAAVLGIDPAKAAALLGETR